MRNLIGTVCFAMVLSGSAWAATLEPGQGSVVINQGQGFQPVNNRIDANVGDSVMVAPGGSATVVYDDGCSVNVQPGAVTTIAPLSPCASGSYAQDNTDSTLTEMGALAVVGGVAGGLIYEGTKGGNGPVTSP